jgi:hypothetical protein
MNHQQGDEKMTAQAQTQTQAQGILVSLSDMIVLSILNVIDFLCKVLVVLWRAIGAYFWLIGYSISIHDYGVALISILSFPYFLMLSFRREWEDYNFKENTYQEQYSEDFSQEEQAQEQQYEAYNQAYNPFHVLGVTDDMSLDEIKRVYHQLCLIYHPDRPTGNKEKFLEIQEAWEQIKGGYK